jgi:S-adenosylmethionine synthetase
VRDTVREIGYTHSDMGFDADSCAVLNAIGKQSPDINQGVDRTDPLEQGAGDQGLMFGYATNETDVLMPPPSPTPHLTGERRLKCARTAPCRGCARRQEPGVLAPTTTTKIPGVDAVVLSAPSTRLHQPQGSDQAVHREEIIKPVLPAEWMSQGHQVLHQPDRPFRDRRPHG